MHALDCRCCLITDSLWGLPVFILLSRFRCSFAHGEDKLDKATRPPRLPPTMQADQTDSRWHAPSSAHLGSSMDHASRSLVSPSAAAAAAPSSCSSQARSYGAPRAVYNEPHGDRGTSASVSFANVAVAPPGGRHARPLDHQSGPMTAPQGYPEAAYAAASSTFVTQGPSHPSSGTDQGRTHVPRGDVSVLPPPSGSGSQLLGPATATAAAATTTTAAAAATSVAAKVLADDDDTDIVEPEFTLEYDDDD